MHQTLILGLEVENLEDLMNIHSRRFPVTIFLLCELLSVDPYLITPESLQFMLLLGNYLEWEGNQTDNKVNHNSFLS